MQLTPGIRKLGFRKWYERELLAGHAHMVLALGCTLGLLMALEAAYRFRGLADQLTDLAAVAVCGVTGVWALRRYLFLLMHAEAAAQQADCPNCGTYARFKLVKEWGDTCAGVQCRQCEHEWQITDAG